MDFSEYENQPIKESINHFLSRLCKECYNWTERYFVNDVLYSHKANFYVLKYRGLKFGVLESDRPNTATYIYVYTTKDIERQTTEFKNDIENPQIDRDYPKTEVNKDSIFLNISQAILDGNTKNIPIKYKYYYLDYVSHHSSFIIWNKRLFEILSENVEFQKQQQQISILTKKVYGKVKDPQMTLKHLYGMSIKQIAQLCHIDTKMLIQLVRNKSPFSNITSQYKVSRYEVEIYRDFFIKYLEDKNLKDTKIDKRSLFQQ